MTNSLTWLVDIDWTDSGSWSGINEAAKMIDISVFRGRRSWLKPDGTGFEPQQTGSLSITLDNTDRQYDVGYSSSPLYPNVTPGKFIRVRVTDNNTSTTYPVFYGVTSTIAPTGYSDEPSVTITAEDGWRFLRSTKILFDNIGGVNDALWIVMDTVQYYSNFPNRLGIDVSVSPYETTSYFPYGKFNNAGDAYEAIDASYGYITYISNTGKINALLKGASTASVKTYNQSIVSKNVDNTQVWNNYRTQMNMDYYPYSLTATIPLYTQSVVPPAMPGGYANSLFVYFSYNGRTAATNLITPVATTDWLLNTAADGSGVDKTSLCSIYYFRQNGVGAWTIFNNPTGLYLYLIKFVIRGQAVLVGNDSVPQKVTYPTSVPTILRQANFPGYFQQDKAFAQNYVNAFGPVLATYNQTPAISLENQPDYQFGIDLQNCITLNMPYLGINSVKYRVGGIQHIAQNTENCQSIKTILYLEPLVAW